MKSYQSFSSGRTKKLGADLAKKTLRKGPHRRGAIVIGLIGELGSGKTTFVQGFLRGLGIRKRSASPTFIIFRRFTLHVPGLKNLYHIDAYRIKKPKEMLDLGLKEILSDPRNIVLIEWADKVKSFLPRGALRLHFTHGKKEKGRKITIN